MHIDQDTLVMVADGRKILVFRNKGGRALPQLEAETVRYQDNPADRDQASDAAGRASSPLGGRQSAVEQVNFHDLEQHRFAVEAVDMLNRRALANDFEKLIIVAPPATLGDMRKYYHKTVQDRLVGEIAKDLANHPVPEIEKIIAEA
jgi:protein required for attachment to host cells